MICDSICECAGVNSGSGMDYHSGRFVDNGEKLVLKNDVERNIFRFENIGLHFDKIDIDLIIFMQFVRRLGRFFVDQHIAVLDQTLQARTRPAFDLFGKKRIKALSRVGTGNGET